MTLTAQVLEYISEFYGAKPEYLWESSENAALRNSRNKKWFAVLLTKLPLKKLGVESDEISDVINLKCDPLMSFSFVDGKGIFRGYHMNKEHWISVLLNGTVSLEDIKMLVDLSFEIVNGK